MCQVPHWLDLEISLSQSLIPPTPPRQLCPHHRHYVRYLLSLFPTLRDTSPHSSQSLRSTQRLFPLTARSARSSLIIQRFAAVVMRIRDPKTTALIFASGKMVVTGAKSEDDSRLASRKYARIIQKLGFDAKFAEFKIQNIVGSCDVKFPIRLEGLAFSHGAFSSYEPEVSFSSSLSFSVLLLLPIPRSSTSSHFGSGRTVESGMVESCGRTTMTRVGGVVIKEDWIWMWYSTLPCRRDVASSLYSSYPNQLWFASSYHQFPTSPPGRSNHFPLKWFSQFLSCCSLIGSAPQLYAQAYSPHSPLTTSLLSALYYIHPRPLVSLVSLLSAPSTRSARCFANQTAIPRPNLPNDETKSRSLNLCFRENSPNRCKSEGRDLYGF
jgi:hypothetical protein